jgi:two-component system, sensor histidine kinase and response regulator
VSRGAEKQGIDSALNARLTFNLEAIACFIHELRDLFECDSYTHQNLERDRQIIRPNDATLQSKFSLLLLEYLLTQPNQEIIAPPSPTAPAVYIYKCWLHFYCVDTNSGNKSAELKLCWARLVIFKTLRSGC